MKKLIILDRDGVINEDSHEYIKTPDEWIPLSGSLEAIAKLFQQGYTIVVATNQSGIARGYYDRETLDKIHQKMQDAIVKQGGEIDKIFYCPHSPEQHCNCRKPQSGLFQQISDYYKIDLHGVPSIGDSLRDLEAAKPLGCGLNLVLTGNGERDKEKAEQLGGVSIYLSLLDYVTKCCPEKGE